MFKISVCIPCYNGEEFLERAVSSLDLASHPEIECVVADNASTDRTPVICEEFSRQHDNFRFERHEDFVGAIENFNRSGFAASSDWFVFLPADDVLFPDLLLQVVDAVPEDPEIGFACCSIVGVNPQGFRFPIVFPDLVEDEVLNVKSDPEKVDRYFSTSVSLPGLVMKTSLFKSIGGLREDFELFTELMFPYILAEKAVAYATPTYVGAFLNRKESSYSSRRPEFLENSIVSTIENAEVRKFANQFPRLKKGLIIEFLRGHFRSGPLGPIQVLRCFRSIMKGFPSGFASAIFFLMLISSGVLSLLFRPLYSFIRSRKFSEESSIPEGVLNRLDERLLCSNSI